MVGQERADAALFAQIAKVAPTRTRVLITGESGTGKELIARAIHRASALREQAVHQGELRGDPRRADRVRAVRPRARRVHRRHGRKAGMFELADGGTIFLDEIGDMMPRRRPRCCACCSRARSRASAASRRSKVDVRVIAATNGSAGGGARRQLPRGSVLPPERGAAARAAAARARRRRPAAVRGVRRARLPRERHEGEGDLRRRRWRCSATYRGRATCASCAT